jgi:hypothetical protein
VPSSPHPLGQSCVIIAPLVRSEALVAVRRCLTSDESGLDRHRHSSAVIVQIREGMDISTRDLLKMGKVLHVWIGTDPSYSGDVWHEELCSRVEVRWAGRPFYLPAYAIDRVSEHGVILTMDAATVVQRRWYRRPEWIPAEPST